MFTDSDGINWFLTALFNPAFLMVILLTYFLGKFLGKLTVNINVWKVLALCYLGVFLYPALITDVTIISVVFGLGVLSNHRRLIFDALFWARDLGDVLFAFRHRAAFRDIRSAERDKDAEIERLKRELEQERRNAQNARRASNQSGSGESQTQQSWREESQNRRGEGTRKNEDRGREAGGSNRRSRSSGSGEKRSRKPAGEKEKGRSDSSSKSSGSSSSRANDGSQQNRTKSSGNSSSTSSSSRSTAQSKPSSDPIRDRNLTILGLKPGREYNPDELKAAWRKMAKKTHPDAGGSMPAFIEVKNAYDALARIN